MYTSKAVNVISSAKDLRYTNYWRSTYQALKARAYTLSRKMSNKNIKVLIKVRPGSFRLTSNIPNDNLLSQ